MLSLFSEKSYKPGQNVRVVRPAMAKFIKRQLVVVCIEGVFRTMVIIMQLAGTPINTMIE